MQDKCILEILEILEKDAKTPAADIAVMLGLSESYVADAIAQMEAEGVIVKYAALVNSDKLDYELAEAFIEVKVDPQRDRGYDDIARRIYRFNEVKSVYLMSGAYDLAVLLQTASMRQISKFVFEKLAVIDGVRSTATHFIMRKYKEAGVIFAKEDEDNRLVVSP